MTSKATGSWMVVSRLVQVQLPLGSQSSQFGLSWDPEPREILRMRTVSLSDLKRARSHRQVSSEG